MSFWSTIWDVIWWFLTAFVFIAYLFALFSIISDLFRDRKLGGWAKAIWMIFLVFLPFLTAFVYLIARGRGMGERAVAQAQEAQAATDEYIRSVVGAGAAGAGGAAAVAGGSVAEIERAKALLDSGAISEDEFQALKAAALRNAG